MHEFSIDRSWLDEVVREAVKQALETVMELEREVFLAEWGGKKNGYYERGLVTKHGPVRLRVPRERDGRFHTALFAPYQRRMEDLEAFALAMYAAGISTRKVGEVLGYLLGETYSASTISRIAEGVLPRLEAFRKRPLKLRYAFVYLDALFVKVFQENEGVATAHAKRSIPAAYLALGITKEGCREVLGFWLLPTESSMGWGDLLLELKERGLEEVLLFITDELPGIETAIKRVYPRAHWQLCTVHKLRSTLRWVRKKDQDAVLRDLSSIVRASDRNEALKALDTFKGRWADKYPQVVASWIQHSAALLRFFDYPKALHPVIKSTNLLERMIKEIKRTTKTRDNTFPTPDAVLKVIYFVAERYEAQFQTRKLRGFQQAEDEIRAIFDRRYPRA